MSVNNKLRHEFEMKLAENLIDCILNAGYQITQNDGEDDIIIKSTDKTKILAELNGTCEDYLFVMNGEEEIGWIYLVWGNADALISDFTTNLEEVIKPANDFVDTYLTGWN